MIHNEGIDLFFDGKRYFTLFNYTVDEEGIVTSHCESMRPGWSRNNIIHPTNFSCFNGSKVNSKL